jgi:uncharacterized OB-fold protein
MSYVGEYSIGRAIARPDQRGVPRLEGSRCPQCGDVRVPSRERCPNDLVPCERFTCSGRATVYEVVKVSLAPQGFEAPFWAGYVDLVEGARIFARVAMGDDGRPPRAGDHVVLTLAPLAERDGEVVTGPLFKEAPAE